MKAAVVYYTLTGNTEYAAEQIAQRIGADLVRIDTVKAYPKKGFAKFLFGGKSAVMKESPELKPYEFDADKFDTVIFGMPVWAGRITPPIRTFIEENLDELKTKNIFVFVSCAGGVDGAVAAGNCVFEMLGCKDPIKDVCVLIDPKDNQSEENLINVVAFCKTILNYQ